jgi:hypothetical protein
MPTSFESTAVDLRRLLEARRDDPTFWTPLTGVLREIVETAVTSPSRSASLPPSAKLLAAWDVDELARRLCDALPQAEDHDLALPDRMIAPGRPFPSISLAALLVLGLAVSACDSSAGDSSGGGGGDGGSAVAAAGHGGIASSTGGTSAGGGTGGHAGAGGAPSTGCEPSVQTGLWSVIDGSTMSAADKQTLHACLVNLKQSWCDGLTQLFATGTQEEIASTLQELVYCCNVRQPGLGLEWSVAHQRLLDGMLCVVAVYKGVAFPD